MKIKVIATTLSVIIGTALLCTGCVNEREDNSSNSELSSSTSSTSSSIKTADIFNLDSQKDMAVTFYYDVEEPTVTFIAPDGTEISSDEIQSDSKSGAVCYYISDAAPGQWQIKYDKKSNTVLDVNWSPWILSNNITVN